jgi:hypothetical protein
VAENHGSRMKNDSKLDLEKNETHDRKKVLERLETTGKH